MAGAAPAGAGAPVAALSRGRHEILPVALAGMEKRGRAQMIYVVLGMHKSGTTLLARILHESGISMGTFDENQGYDEGNKYERQESHDLNIDLLGCDPGEFSLNLAHVVREANIVPHETWAKLEEFVHETSRRHSAWGFKDPRTCLTYAVWKAVLPGHKLIAIFRHPLELWLHYQPKKRFKKIFGAFTGWKSMTAWYVYNREILQALQAANGDCLALEYGEFMKSDSLFSRLCGFAGRKLKDVRNSGLYRNKILRSHWLYEWTLALQKFFCRRDLSELYQTLRKEASRCLTKGQSLSPLTPAAAPLPS
jgi:hypothetical protein